MYADFECILEPVEDVAIDGIKTIKKHKHVPSSFAYLIKCSFDETLDYFDLYRGENSAKQFVDGLSAKVKQLYEDHVFNKNVAIEMSAEDESAFQNTNVCFICKNIIVDPDDKIREHCHITGRYRGCAHTQCNLKYRLKHEVPVIFHNFSKYDSHLFIKELCQLDSAKNIEIIPSNTETYISVSKSIKLERTGESERKRVKTEREKQVYLRLEFKDSFRFLGASIESLAKSLDPVRDFKNLEKLFPLNHDLLKRKGKFRK